MLVEKNYNFEENILFEINISPLLDLTAFSYIFSTNISPRWGLTAFYVFTTNISPLWGLWAFSYIFSTNILPRWGFKAFSYIFSTNISPRWSLLVEFIHCCYQHITPLGFENNKSPFFLFVPTIPP
jgi:hypothetical protein